ncbi:hypothetical protein [Streptomyces sp. 1222.2]|uniref:hypothetical protein n=1 Tax=Streptomyces sp. 1222.2 TaxID=1938833 RepID=UPI00211C8337|nr:hypothetical protein [Streptomyces sp. 1222.2]
MTLANLRNWAPIVGIQHEYSLVERTADRGLLPMAESLGLGAALPHEGIAAALDRLQGGAADRVNVPVMPVA